ncbi:MAG: sugar phosphate isomerase/epimerase family protein [Vicinamibacterales bacterium]
MRPSSASTYLSSLAVPRTTVPAAIEWCARHGITHLEFTSSFRYHVGLADDLRAAPAEFALLIHNYFPPPVDPFVINLASDDRGVRERSIEHCRHSIDLAAEVGAPYYSVHAGFSQDLKPSQLGGHAHIGPGASLTDAAARFIESTRCIAEHAERRGLDVLVENNVLPRRHLVNGRNTLLLAVGANDIHALLSGVDHPRVGLLLDVGHLKVSAAALGEDAAELLRGLKPWVRGLHLSDNDGTTDTNDLYGEDAWFLPALPEFSAYPWVLETRPADPEETLKCLSLTEQRRHMTVPRLREDHGDQRTSH